MGGLNIWTLAVLIAAGIILANLIVNPNASKTLFDALGKVWKWAVNSMMGGN